MNAMFCERLKLARREKGMSQEKFSRRTGIGRPEIAKYENGIRQPAMDNLMKLAQILDCSIDWLVGLED